MELSLALFIRLLLKGKYVDWIGSCIVACYPCWLVWGGGSGYLEGHWMSPGSNLTTCAAWKLLMVKLNILVAPSIFCVMYLLMMLINWWTFKKMPRKVKWISKNQEHHDAVTTFCQLIYPEQFCGTLSMHSLWTSNPHFLQRKPCDGD